MYSLLNKIKDKIRKCTPAMKMYEFADAGWYRIAQISSVSVFSSILQIVKTYNSGRGPNGAIVAVEGLYSGAQASVLMPATSSTGIKKIRISYKSGNPYYIDAYYDGDAVANSISFRFLTNILISGNVVLPIFPDELTPAVIPEGYSTKEWDITTFGWGGGYKKYPISAKICRRVVLI